MKTIWPPLVTPSGEEPIAAGGWPFDFVEELKRDELKRWESAATLQPFNALT